ncbi:methionine ABC transporter permease [Vagococcus elongatus]|uniref:Methionine ABC transporter ATP-binding protein n=1 Tax=Vagococcus elongatus TaxID=180344 RepID=A0A430AU09_9ENTE|nr:ABC transporter permease subunit [Vagococcus elongatus]RSU11540.1 methionine ABC transporter ATP-binding protein [Vagococcus elongatus]
MSSYLAILEAYQGEMALALGQTLMMIVISMSVALLIGLPMGTVLYLRTIHFFHSKPLLILSRLVNLYVDIVRSFPFLLFVVSIIPFTRFVLGTSFGTMAAAFPLCFVATANYARMSEQALLDVPRETLELSKSLCATTWQLIFHFLYVEARSGLVLGFTTVTIGMISYSTIMGVVGGGGIGDFAIRYGYQSYEYELMYTTIVVMIVSVVMIQTMGTLLASHLDKRKIF